VLCALTPILYVVVVNGKFCIFHHNKSGDNSVAKFPYKLDQRFELRGMAEAPRDFTKTLYDVQSISLGPDIGDACLLFLSLPSGVVTIDIGQLEAATNTVENEDMVNSLTRGEIAAGAGSGEDSENSSLTSAKVGGSVLGSSMGNVSLGAMNHLAAAANDDPAGMPAPTVYMCKHVSHRHNGPINSVR